MQRDSIGNRFLVVGNLGQPLISTLALEEIVLGLRFHPDRDFQKRDSDRGHHLAGRLCRSGFYRWSVPPQVRRLDFRSGGPSPLCPASSRVATLGKAFHQPANGSSAGRFSGSSIRSKGLSGPLQPEGPRFVASTLLMRAIPLAVGS